MSNQQELNVLREGYQKVSNSLISGKIPDENTLKRQRNFAIKATNKANQKQVYTNLEELIYYRNAYDKIIELKNKDSINPIKKDQIIKESKNILKAEPENLKSFVQESKIKNQSSSKITPYLQNQPQTVANPTSLQGAKPSILVKKKQPNFFEERKSKIQQTVSFRDTLVIPDLPSGQYNFKKKSKIGKDPVDNNQYQSELNSLREQNNQLMQLIDGNQSNLAYKIQQKQKRIQQLQQQIRYITIDNQRLRQNQLSSQKSPIYNQYNLEPYSQNFQNYNLNPLNNDLQAISSHKSDFNYKQSKVSNYRSQQLKQHPSKYKQIQSVNRFNPNEEKIDEIHSERNLNDRGKEEGYRMNSLISIQREGDFDSFSMGNPGFSIVKSRAQQYGVKDPATCSRNKAAFFKNSLVIVKDEDYQIAFKKSKINVEKDELRLIFYVYNKTFNHDRVSIQYVDESHNYTVTVKEQLTELEANSRGRQDIIVKLNNTFELTSIIDAYFKIGDRTYQLWIPANFIQFDSRYRDISRTTQIVTVKPDRIFANYQIAISLLQLTNKHMIGNQVVANMYGSSRCHEGAVKLTWRLDGKLDIQTSDRWIDYIGFLLCKVR